MATRKILPKLFIMIIALFIFLPVTSFAKGGTASATMTVSCTVVVPTTIKISSATIKGVTSSETSEIKYDATSDLEPLFVVEKEIVKGELFEVVTIIF